MNFLLLLLLAADPKQAITFQATFNKSFDADKAAGDKSIYFAPDYKDLSKAVKGPGSAPVTREKGALHFTAKHTTALFYRLHNNVSPTTGTISFKLKLDPQQDLAPDYVDPIQFTDRAYNDHAIWVDFTKDEKPRHFRLGMFGDLKTFNDNTPAPERNKRFLERLVILKTPPFTRDKWTHVVITYQPGSASLYLDGKLQGTTSAVTEPFAWDTTKATIRLGVNYSGWFDDLTVYSRPLTIEEIAKLK
jgi:hypothetical protein